ncbi:hypothetical protein EJ02DRAFT_266246 [Clathrospora elynae]|uniref:Uncharacterized protein n=1 Tax=Clathrospora elynae TaxID=706981 RepID=A0A6A5SH87_9PLEO|nr:hypothetical protein EJ02DRAFT_266246 [Clathrospora elynae]
MTAACVLLSGVISGALRLWEIVLIGVAPWRVQTYLGDRTQTVIGLHGILLSTVADI